jgi:steroid delta-isomerase-like uncharacterized protein
MKREQMEALLRRWMRFWQGDDLASFDEVHAPDFVDRSPSGRPADRAGFRAGIEELYRGMPDFRAEVDDLVIDEARQRAAVRWHGSGTHRGPMMGMPATGARIEFEGIELLRLADDRIAERWGHMDSDAVREQLRRAAARRRRDPPG